MENTFEILKTLNKSQRETARTHRHAFKWRNKCKLGRSNVKLQWNETKTFWGTTSKGNLKLTDSFPHPATELGNLQENADDRELIKAIECNKAILQKIW